MVCSDYFWSQSFFQLKRIVLHQKNMHVLEPAACILSHPQLSQLHAADIYYKHVGAAARAAG